MQYRSESHVPGENLTPSDGHPIDLFAPTPIRQHVADFTLHDSGRSAGPSYHIAPVPLPPHPINSLDFSDSETQQSWEDYINFAMPLQDELNNIIVPEPNDYNHSGSSQYYDHTNNRYDSQRPQSLSPSRRRSARISPEIVDQPPQQLKEPPGPGATPLRSALRKPIPLQDLNSQSQSGFLRPRTSSPARPASTWQRPASISQPVVPLPSSSPLHPPQPRSGSNPCRYSHQHAPPPPVEPPIVPIFHNAPNRGGYSTRQISPPPIEPLVIPEFRKMSSSGWNPDFFDTPEDYDRRIPLQNIQPPIPPMPPQHGAPCSCYPVAPAVKYHQCTPHPSVCGFTPQRTTDQAVTQLLHVPADRVVWQTSQGELAWIPHPRPAPSVPPSSFWTSNPLGMPANLGQGMIAINAHTADLLTGGNPLPGTAPYWTPGAWPPTSLPSRQPGDSRVPIQVAPWIIPNPCNAYLPHLMWDISQLPSTAKRITGNHVIVDITSKFNEVVTYPPVDRLVVVCNVGVAQDLWGPLEVKQSSAGGVRIWDVLMAIYEYFQARVGRRELDRISQTLGDPDLYNKMADAMYQRCMITPALPGYERKNGLKRIDCLGDMTFFWGLYASYNGDSTWHLNLGLVNRKRVA